MKNRIPTYRNLIWCFLLMSAAWPTFTKGQANLPCPPIDVSRADAFYNATSTLSSFSFSNLADFENGKNALINLYIDARGGKTYQIRYRFLNGAEPVLSYRGNSISSSGAFKATASFGSSGWGTLNVQTTSSNVALTTGWSTLATFKARCGVTHGNLMVDLKALGINDGNNNFFVKGATPQIDYGAVTVEFQLFQTDNNTQQDLQTIPYEILIGDVLDFSINNGTTTISATPQDYINGIEVTANDQLRITSNSSYSIDVASSSNTLAPTGNGASGTIDISDIQIGIANSTPNMGNTNRQNLHSTSRSIANGAQISYNKSIDLIYRLQNTKPKNLQPGTYSGTIYISVTEN